MRDRKGFTLIELLIVAVLGALVVAAALQVLVTNQRTYTVQSAQIAGQQSTRMALELLFNELREASPEDGDILAKSSDSIRVRLMRKVGIVCAMDLTVPATPIYTVLNNAGERFEGLTDPDPDSVVLFADNDENDDGDDVWLKLQVTAVDTTTTCLSGRRSTDVAFAGQIALLTADSVRDGALMRSYRTYTFGLTTLLGDTYLGRREMSGAMTPIAGPLKPTGGLEFIYRDENGAVTNVNADIRQIEVRIRTTSSVTNSKGDLVSDSITAWIYTRN